MSVRAPRRWAAVAAALPLVLVPLFAGPAHADDASTGQWYLDALHIRDAHAAGLTGAGVTVAIMDSPVNTEVPALAGADIEPQEPSCLDDSGAQLPVTSTDLSGTSESLHGTNVAAMLVGTGAGYEGQIGIQGIAPGARLLYYSVVYDGADGELICPQANSQGFDVEDALGTAIDDAIDAGADIISISLGTHTSEILGAAIARAHREGVVILAAVPNETLKLNADWPGHANGVVAVGAVDSTGRSPANPDSGTHDSFTYTTVAAPGVDILNQGTVGGAWTDQSLGGGHLVRDPDCGGSARARAPEVSGCDGQSAHPDPHPQHRC